ncbi:MAG: glycine cleavage system aminomethyltransferase GcvT [Acidobacteria bacterium]|nr:glycine cleavage system aminomethyltransferase GcvT [Acidobacteriota bacterium]
MTLKKTPLNALHKEYGARMVDFAGWEMPVHYGSALKEHFAVRERVGIFDVSHMGEIEFIGPGALAMAQKVTSNDVSRLSDGQAQYSAFLYPQGTFIDDIVVYRISDQHIFVCVNAANREKDYQWVKSKKEGRVDILDNSDSYVQLAIQGPKAEAVLQELTDLDLSSIQYYGFTFGNVNGTRCLISRTGYTGENGFEIYIPVEEAPSIWERLFQVGKPFGIMAAGLAARNTLRLEVAYCLYGHEIDETTTPWEAGLGWIVRLGKGEFIGHDSLEKLKEEGKQRKLAGFEMVGRGIARDHYPVIVDGTEVGQVTSGSFAPSLKKSVGLVYLPIQYARIGQPLEVEIRGKRVQAKVVETPFYTR